MNIGGGEAADQMVRMMLSGSEVAVRLSGSALKNLLALSLALAKDHKKISGKVNMAQMLKETRDLRTFPMTPQQFQEFRKLAGKHKLLYSSVHDKDDRGKLIDVVLPVTELDRANLIFERMKQPLGRPEYQVPEQDPARPRQEAPEQREADRSGQDHTQEAAAPQRPQQERGGGDSPLQHVSHDTRTSSNTPDKVRITKMTSERPSVEGRLKGYREQLDKAKKSAPVKVKSRPKTR